MDPNANNRVEKMLSPEEVSMLSNIQSLLGEVMRMGGDPQGNPNLGTVEASCGVRKAENGDGERIATTEELDKNVEKQTEGEEKEKEKEVEKMLVSSPSDSATASDSAEERIEETQTELTEEGVDEVAKAIYKIANAFKNNVNKSTPTNPLIDAMYNLAEVQKSTQEQINVIAQGFNNLIEGMGIAEQMKVTKSLEDQKSSQGVPLVNPDSQEMQGFLNVLNQMVQGQAVQKDQGDISYKQSNHPIEGSDNNSIIRKNLSDRKILGHLVANKDMVSGNFVE